MKHLSTSQKKGAKKAARKTVLQTWFPANNMLILYTLQSKVYCFQSGPNTPLVLATAASLVLVMGTHA